MTTKTCSRPDCEGTADHEDGAVQCSEGHWFDPDQPNVHYDIAEVPTVAL